MGNQLFEYAAARRLAYKLGVELKLKPWFDKRFKDRPQYELENFNISGELATPEDIENVNKINAERETPLGVETKYPNGLFRFIPEILDYPDNVNLSGCWQSEKYFADIEDVLRRELTFKFDDTGGGEKILGMACKNSRGGLPRFASCPPRRLHHQLHASAVVRRIADRLLRKVRRNIEGMDRAFHSLRLLQ